MLKAKVKKCKRERYKPNHIHNYYYAVLDTIYHGLLIEVNHTNNPDIIHFDYQNRNGNLLKEDFIIKEFKS